MKLTWLGHSGFRIEIGDQVLLVDPWVTGNPMFPEERRAEAIAGATHVLLSHGHGDHSSNVLSIVKELGIPAVGMFEIMEHWSRTEGIDAIGFSKGGTVRLGDVAVTMVNAVHSSSLELESGPLYAGSEAGFMIAGEGHVIYFTGDTDVMADMKIFQDLHAPDIWIPCIGGHYTMDQRRAIYAAREFFDFKVIIPCHYKTFPVLAQDAEALKAALPGIVREPEVMVSMEL